MDMEERIKELMEAKHLNQQAFADFLGISSATLSSIFKGRTKVTLNTIKAIKEKFPNLNYSWLLDGIGPMFNDDKSGVSNSSSTPSANSSEEAFIDFGDNPDVSASEAQDSESDGILSAAVDSSNSSLSNQSSARQTVNVGRSAQRNPNLQSSNPNIVTTKIFNNKHRSVSQILVIYDDQTCETFVPKK